MNYIFGKDECEISDIDVYGSCYEFENINFIKKELELFKHSNKELDDFESLKYEPSNISEDKTMNYENVSEIANFGEESESVSRHESIDLLYQIEPAARSIQDSTTEHSQYAIAKSIFGSDECSWIDTSEKTKSSILDLELTWFRSSIINVADQLIEEKTETGDQTFSHISEGKTIENKTKRKSGYYRWNTIDDAKMFRELRKACKQSNIDIEDFSNIDCYTSNQHRDILNTLVDKLQWRRDANTLLKRIMTLSKKQTLSGRQIKILKKIIQCAKAKNEVVSVETIVDMFPGKSLTNLQRYIDQISRFLHA